MKVTVTVGKTSREFEVGEEFSTLMSPDQRERVAQQSQRNTAMDSLMQAFTEALAEEKGEPAPSWGFPFTPKVSRPSKEA